MIEFTGERIVPEADNCEPRFAEKMYQEHVARYAFAAQWVRGKRVLDVGCGVGYGSRWLAENGAASVLAFDLSADAIGHAREFYGHPNVTYKVASATEFDFGERFDVITCFELIEHVDQQQAVIQCIRRAIKDDGVLIISTPRALETKRTHFHTHEFSEAEFRALLESSFTQVRFYFENNHFSSLITDHKPTQIERIMPLNDQYSLGQADYFIAVASPAESTPITDVAKPVMVVGDDKYVTLLERDIGILYQSQDQHIKSLAEKDRQLALQRSDIHYLEELLAQMRASTSWKVTAPLRLVGHKLHRPARLLRKATEYRKQHGTRALVNAVRRRLERNIWLSPKESVPLLPTANIANRRFDIVFAIGCWEGESKRYRVYNIAEGLTKMGYEVHVMPFAQIGDLAEHNVKADVVVLFRAPFETTSRVDDFLKYANTRGIKVVFDVDDLVFEPDVIDQIDGVRLLSDDEKRSYIAGVHAYRKLLLASDMVTVPTEYLRAKVQATGRPAYVIPNSINDKQLTIAAQIANEGERRGGPVRIGYFSGSRTHQADFAQCADALFTVMQLYTDTKLRIVGYLELDARWDALAGRIERLDFQPYETMLRTLNDCDINLAPLELRSAFCQGKSELKFFEAGLLGIPTVASATDTFNRVIQNGSNGFCAMTPEDWRNALEALVNSKELRESIGAKAKKTAIDRFAIDHVAKLAAEVYGLHTPNSAPSPLETSVPLAPGRLRIAWVIPGLIIGGGGHRNILRAAFFLSQFGHQISLYFTGTDQDPRMLKRQIQEHFYPLDCPVYLFDGKIHPVDVVFATHWSTVSAALTAKNTAREIMYFVQDFEPAFAPMGTEYVLAENTYRMGLYHITSGPWCEVVLRRDFQAEADHFRFPVDRSVYYPRPRTKANKNLIFFAKPEMPRRCFELGVMALREFHRLRPDVEIVMFGSKNAGKQKYDFPVTIRDIVPTLNDLAEMYSNGDVGLVFSTTNPSLIPYEMMACGLPVVDMDRGDNAVNYANRTDIALLANPLPEKMATDIATLIGDKEELSSRRAKGLEFVDQFPSEEEMAKRIENLVLHRMSLR